MKDHWVNGTIFHSQYGLTDEQGSQVHHHHLYLSTLLTLNIEIQNTEH